MREWADVIPFLALRAEELAATMLSFAVSPTDGRRRDAQRRALGVAARARALAAAVGFAEGDDALAAAMELAQIEEAADDLLRHTRDTVRPPPSASGTFVVERKKASTNRLLAVRVSRD